VKMEAWSLQSVGHISAGARPSIGSGRSTGSISCMPARTASADAPNLRRLVDRPLPTSTPSSTPHASFLPIHSLLLALQFSSPPLSLLLMIDADSCMHAYHLSCVGVCSLYCQIDMSTAIAAYKYILLQYWCICALVCLLLGYGCLSHREY
jgi:hypothetical protein